MSEKEKMLAGQLYDPGVEELRFLREKSQKLCLQYNQTSEGEVEKRDAILKELGVTLGADTFLRGPIYFDYGCFISIGQRSYANYNLTILDCARVKIGCNAFIGSGVSLVTPVHPMRYKDRNQFMTKEGSLTDYEFAKEITIEDNCWIASNVTICGGVTIGEGSVIGAGSVVTRSIPKNSFAAGNPCRVIRKIDND